MGWWREKGEKAFWRDKERQRHVKYDFILLLHGSQGSLYVKKVSEANLIV